MLSAGGEAISRTVMINYCDGGRQLQIIARPLRFIRKDKKVRPHYLPFNIFDCRLVILNGADTKISVDARVRDVVPTPNVHEYAVDVPDLICNLRAIFAYGGA